MDVQWLVNGTELESLNLTNVRPTLETAAGGGRKLGEAGVHSDTSGVQHNHSQMHVITMNENLTADKNSTLLIQSSEFN